MAYADLPRPARSLRLPRLLSEALSAWTAWREAAATHRALSRLSDHELADIGLTRADLDDLVAPRRA